MQYFGGKFRISKPLAEFLNSQIDNDQTFVDLFCGSLNVATRIRARNIACNDRHSYLVRMWEKVISGWIPPTAITEEEYKHIKENHLDGSTIDPALAGFVGFACSFSGKWWGGYARNNRGTNYAKGGSNSIVKKVEKLKGTNVQFSNLDYSEVSIPDNSVVYCDIPYRGTTQYSQKEVGKFDHDRFYDWVIQTSRRNSVHVFVSEYEKNVPDGFKVVWQHSSKKYTRNKHGQLEPTSEALIEYSSA